MATDLERLVVSLEARTAAFERAMNRANGIANTRSRQIESRFASMNSRLNAGFVGLQRGIAAAFAGVAVTRGAVQLIDAATRIENSLKVAGVAAEDLDQVYGDLFQAAQRNAAPIETLVQLYSRLALVQNELGVTGDELIGFTDNVALALRVAGTDAQAASGALLQLSQALGGGVVRAEEFNSILEGATPIVQAVANGLEEAGGSVAKLRTLVVDGKVSSEAFFRAFEVGAATLEDKVAGAELTVAQQFTRLQNVLIDVAREMNEGTQASKVLGDGIANLADIVRQLGDFINYAVGPMQSLIGLFDQGVGSARAFANELARISGLEGAGFAASTFINDLGVPGLTSGSSAAGRVLTQTFELLGATPEDEALARALAGEAPAEPLKITVEADDPRRVSLADYPIGGASGGGGGGGGSSSDRFAKAIASQQQRIDALNRETELQRQLGIAVNDYGFAIERLRAQMELENAATEAGLALTPQRQAQIDELATGYARATAEAARLAEAQDLVRQAADDMGQAARGALDSIIDGFLEGRDAGEILNSVIKDLAKNLLSTGLNLLGGGMKAGGFNPLGFLGGMFGFASGTANTGGARGQPRGIVHGQEAVIPLPNGGRVPVDIRMPSMAAGAPQALTVRVVSDDEKFSAYVEDGAGRVVAKSAPAIVTTATVQSNKTAPGAVAKYQRDSAGGDYRL
ncbi:tape measure protein [Devosia sp. Naph2]|uniref:tape measure protein n=1 Tax=Devosia polycyclovorans TaxID=3345148 RepID=UPI0035CEC0FD